MQQDGFRAAVQNRSEGKSRFLGLAVGTGFPVGNISSHYDRRRMHRQEGFQAGVAEILGLHPDQR